MGRRSFGGRSVPFLVMVTRVGLFLGRLDDPVLMLGRAVEGVKLQRPVADVADIVAGAGRDDHAAAVDVYAEGTLIFPVVKVQSDYENIDDIMRMCRSRIRVPKQWYGDYLAALGATRVAERRLKEFVAKYGVDAVKQFEQSIRQPQAETGAAA